MMTGDVGWQTLKFAVSSVTSRWAAQTRRTGDTDLEGGGSSSGGGHVIADAGEEPENARGPAPGGRGPSEARLPGAAHWPC